MWSSILLSGLLASAALADHNSLQTRNHHAAIAAKRAENSTLEKRFEGARFTYFAVGLGACGKWSKPSDFMVALNDKQFGGGYPGPNCFRRIKISYGGKSTHATILDECPGCPYGALDLSQGLFEFFAPTSAGVINGAWSFDDGGDDPAPAPAPKPDPKPAPKPDPKPDPPIAISIGTGSSPNNADNNGGQGRVKAHSKTSSKAKPTSTSKSKSKSKSKTSASKTKLSTSKASATASVNYHKGNAANLAVPTGGKNGSVYASGGLASLDLAVIQFGALIVTAGKST